MNNVGGRVVHSYGRLIPHLFLISDLQQISGPGGTSTGRINCTNSTGNAMFVPNGGTLGTGGVTEVKTGPTATLEVNPADVSFQNRQLYCTNINANFFYLFVSGAG